MNKLRENRVFEDQVRKAAEEIFGLEVGSCQAEAYQDRVISELDGIARLRDVTHLIMATVSRRLEKVKSDVKKLDAAERIERQTGIPVKKWLITESQLEAEHVKHCRTNNVEALTLRDFKNRFFDGNTYLARRRNRAFGSARNPEDGSIDIAPDEYVDLPMTVSTMEGQDLGDRGQLSITDLCERLKSGQTIVLLGTFGAGKSLTVREVFRRLGEQYQNRLSEHVPVAISLRDHWGSKYPDEVLERHAREIGFARREDLVVAWRSGMLTLLIDGFDEVATQVVADATDRNFMRTARYEALAATRQLISETPRESGTLITGRGHYFDDKQEMLRALGLKRRECVFVELAEFTDQSAQTYLNRRGLEIPLPSWLPRKPLLLAYLVRSGLLPEVVAIDGRNGFGNAWDAFLDLICEREGEYGRAVMDPKTLRRLLERLAWDVRSRSEGVGPIAGRELAEAYTAETGQTAGEGVVMQLQRLPGLTPRDQDPGSRAFVDSDLLAALQGSALARSVTEGSTIGSGRRSLSSLTSKSLAMGAYRLAKLDVAPSTVIATALREAQGAPAARVDPQFVADCVSVTFEMTVDDDRADCLGLTVAEACLGVLDLEERSIMRLKLADCYIEKVLVGAAMSESTVVMERCEIGVLAGLGDAKALPNANFRNCTVSQFHELATNAAVTRSKYPDKVKVLVTILRKLYLQSGGGRKVGALRRGLPGNLTTYVDEILHMLQSEDLVYIFKDIVHPVRRHTRRVKAIVAAPMMAEDPILSMFR